MLNTLQADQRQEHRDEGAGPMTFSPEDLAQHRAALRGEDIYAQPPRRRALPPAEGRTLPAGARAWDLTPGAVLGARRVARVATGDLHGRSLPVVRVWWEGDEPEAAPSLFHPWQRFNARPGTQPGARWLARQCREYAGRHSEGWTLEGMRAHVAAMLEAERTPITTTPRSRA